MSWLDVPIGQPGPQGPPGEHSPLTVHAGSPNLSIGKAVAMINGQIALANATYLDPTLLPVGIVIQAGIAGDSLQTITQGLVDPALKTLGAGVACAVGTDVNGNPVRVTDAACVSKLKILGVCDANGAIYVAPRVADGFRLDDYGGDPSGTIDSSSAFDAMVAAALASRIGANCVIPPGSFKIASKRTIYNAAGLKIIGAGAQSSLVWIGNTTDPLLLLASCYACTFADFGISTSQTLAIGIQITTSSAMGHGISTRNTFRGVGVAGVSTEVQECVVIGGDLDANNDYHVFNECTFANYNKRAVRISDTQSYQHRFINCFFQPIPFVTVTGSISNGSNDLSVTTDTFTSADVGKFVEVLTAFDGLAPLRTTITTVTDSKHVVLADAAGATATSVDVSTGPGEGIRGDKGSYTVEGGASTGHLNTAFYQSNVSSQSVTIRDFADEGSRGLLRSSGPSSGTEKMALIECVRFAGNGAIAYVPCIEWNFPGQLEVRNSQIGDFSSDHEITCSIGSPAFDQTAASVKFTNVIFAPNSSARTATDIFATGIVPSLENCHIYSGSYVGDLPDVHMQNEVWVGQDELQRVKSIIARVQTTDATPTTCLSFTLNDETATDFCFTVLAKDTVTDGTYRQDFRVTYTRQSGAPNIQGSLTTGVAVATGSLATATATIDISSNDIRVRVTGVVATTISWSAIMQAQQVK